MIGKYSSLVKYIIAYIYRQYTKKRISSLVAWDKHKELSPGCTAIIGMCHLLPEVLIGNLRCLYDSSWPDLKEVIITVDSVEGCLPDGIEKKAREILKEIDCKFIYYTKHQAEVAEKIRLPFVFSWLSWSICIQNCKTTHALIHDYDALLLGDVLSAKYNTFKEQKDFAQGISWYNGNGVEEVDHLATTFELFVDIEWLLKFPPIDMFNQIGMIGKRTVDFDTLLYIQEKKIPENKRSIVKIPEESLVHPSQMIHQYTMFRRFPNKPMPSFSIILIPFFEWFSGKESALSAVCERMKARNETCVDLLGIGAQWDLALLSSESIDWALKQMVRVCIKHNIDPNQHLYEYGSHLYQLSSTPGNKIWAGDFSAEQREWINKASALFESGSKR